jgi:hypothetical protein
MVAGTSHVPSAIQKPLVFEATEYGVCLLPFYGIQNSHNLDRACRYSLLTVSIA